jgi:hypothetical protein
MILLLVGAAMACSSHPPAEHDEAPQRPLCVDASSLMTRGHERAMLFAERGSLLVLRSSLRPLTSYVSIEIPPLLAFHSSAHRYSLRHETGVVGALRLQLAVLRL